MFLVAGYSKTRQLAPGSSNMHPAASTFFE